MRHAAATFRAFGLSLLALVLVYVPAFILVGVLRPSVNRTVPVLISVTFAIACILAVIFALWRGMSLSDFGLRLPSWRYGGIALAISIPLSALAQVAVMRVHEAGPLAGLSLPLGAVCFYFLLCAPVQEEFIFRGLVQSIFAKEVSTVSASAWPGVLAGCTAAILFGLVHLVVGPATAAAALVLGFVAGELRRQSGSLLPAILSHAIFNLPGIFFG